MRQRNLTCKIILFFFSLIITESFAAEQKLPVIKGKRVVAVVNEETITLDEYNRELFPGTRVGGEKAEGKIDSELLRRLINTRLIIQEAKRTELVELPEIKKRIEVFL